jgi:hypothetical protein
MPRNTMMDMLMARDGRRMRRMRDRGMGYGHYGVRGGEHYPMDNNYPNSQYADERSGRGSESSRQSDMGYDDIDMRRRRNARGQYMSDRGYEHEMMDGHYGAEGKTYYPIEAMGRFNGYWGMPEEDYGRYDMRGRGGRRDYGYYGEDYGDYGETLTKEELEHWNKKMLKEVDDKYKNYFTKENIAQKARALGVQMEGFNEDELLTSTIMEYTDYCDVLKPYIGENMDVYMKMGKAFLLDKDSAVKGGQKLALYHDEVVMAEEDD